MKVERRDVAGVAVLVAGESVDRVWVAMGKRFRWLEGGIGDYGCIVGNDFGEVGWAVVLRSWIQQKQ